MNRATFSISGAFQKGVLVALAANGAGLLCACPVLALGFLGAGLSSGTTADLRANWYSFVGLAFCVPAVLNTGVLAWVAYEAARKKEPQIWLGWLTGLAIALIPLLVLAIFSILIGGV